MGWPVEEKVDQFDDADDAFLGSLELEEPPLKKPKVQEFSDDDDLLFSAAEQMESSFEFESHDDDDLLFSVAEELEKSFEIDEDEFKTRIGRPHPLLIPDVLENVMKNICDGKTLSSCRLVSTAWYDAATVHWIKYNTIHNVIHIVNTYPYGLSYDAKTKDFETEYNFPGILNLKIADPCFMFTKPIVNSYFTSHGHALKSFTLDANFWCVDHMSLLQNVLFNWCLNLEDLNLYRVTNTHVMNHNSSMFFNHFSRKKSIKLKNLGVTASFPETQEHHHFSTSKVISPDFDFNIMSRIGNNNIGVLGKIIRVADNLNSITVRSHWENPSKLIVYNILKHLSTLEINGGIITRSDLNRIMGVSLRVLKIGPVTNLTNNFKRLLYHQSINLEELELYGDDKSRRMVIKFPKMIKLTKLVIHDGLCTHVLRNNEQNFPRIKTLQLSANCTTSSDQSRVINTVKRLANDKITTLELNGKLCYANADIHIWYPNVKVLRVTVLGERSFLKMIEKITKLRRLEELQIKFTACNTKQVSQFSQEFLPKIKNLKNLTLHFLGFINLVPFTSIDYNAFIHQSPIRNLNLVNYVVYEDEAESLATMLAEKLLSVTFKSCKIQSRRINKSNIIKLDNVFLCKFTLKSLMRSHFQDLH